MAGDFLFRNDADRLLLRGRVAISLFTLMLGLLVFLAGREMFDRRTGLLALGFLASGMCCRFTRSCIFLERLA